MKKIILLLLTLSNLTLMVAQNNILKVRITLKGESQKPLDGVKVIADKANEAYTKNGEVLLTCKGKSEGEFVSLTIDKKGYVVINLNALQKVVISKNPDVSFDIEMQEEGERKSEIEQLLKSINTKINAQNKELNDIVTKYTQYQAHDEAKSQASMKVIQKSQNDIKQLIQNQDSIKNIALQNGFSQLIQELDNDFKATSKGIDKIDQNVKNQIKAADRLTFLNYSVNTDPETFNHWNLIKKIEDVNVEIDSESVNIRFDNIMRIKS